MEKLASILDVPYSNEKYGGHCTNYNHKCEEKSLNIPFYKHSNKNIQKKKFNVDLLSNEVINLINDVYHEDFILFGYKKMITQ